MKRIPPSLRSLANRPTRYPAAVTGSLELTPLPRIQYTSVDSSALLAPTGVPPTRSLTPAPSRDLAASIQYSPRQLSERLDLSVVGQIKAKRILSVAIYNHYMRVQYIRDTLAARKPLPDERATELKSQIDREEAFDSPYPSHNFSVFNRDEFKSPTTSSPPRSKGSTLVDRTKEGLFSRPLPTAPQEEQLAYMIQEKGMEGDLTADPDEGVGRTTPKRSPIMTFENSYPPNSFTPAPKKRRPTPVTLLPPDPTAYDSTPVPPEPTKRKSKHLPESTFESETLTDFPGQVSGTVREDLTSRKAFPVDNDALIQDKSNVLM